MHSMAIFVGVLLFGWGVNALRMALLMAKLSRTEVGGLGEPFWDRWLPYILAAIMLPMPLALSVGGGALVRWGFLGG